MKRTVLSICVIMLILTASSCRGTESGEIVQSATPNAEAVRANSDAYSHLPDKQREFARELVSAAIERTSHEVDYDPAYISIPYPGGDVPEGTGVCTDVVIRSYRKVGVDLQKEVHEDMKQNFNHYPKTWGLKSTDSNIDHRRVPNLKTFFARKGETLPVTDNPDDYLPGDIVTQVVWRNLPHIAIVTDIKVPGADRYMIVHNIGRGPRLEDELFGHKITGHYRYIKELPE